MTITIERDDVLSALSERKRDTRLQSRPLPAIHEVTQRPCPLGQGDLLCIVP